MKLQVQRISSQPRTKYLYSKGNYKAMNTYFQNTEWESLLLATNVEVNWGTFKELYLEAMGMFILHKSVMAGQRLNSHRHVVDLFADDLLEMEIKSYIDKAILNAKAHYEKKNRSIQWKPETLPELRSTLHEILEYHRRLGKRRHQNYWRQGEGRNAKQLFLICLNERATRTTGPPTPTYLIPKIVLASHRQWLERRCPSDV